VNLASPADLLSVFKPTTRTSWDWITPFAILGLSAFGVAFIFSAQFQIHDQELVKQYWFKQLVFLGLGAALYVAVSLIDYRFWLGVVHWIYVACLISLVLVLIPGIGREVYGSRRWLFVFQPSETAKIAMLLMAASILVHAKISTITASLGTLGKLALAVGGPMLLILLQPDLKSAIVLPPMVFAMLYVSKLSARFFLVALGAFLVLVSIAVWDTRNYARFMAANHLSYDKANWGKYEAQSWVPLHDYQRNRILPFVAPDSIDPVGIAWNQRQSLISVGSGGVMGKGWTEGTQAQLGYLPRSVAHNDFIFSVIAEEKGFLGSITVLGLFAVVMFNGIRIASHARDRLGMLLAVGVTVLFAVHVFVNIAMTIGLVPITGIPLPFISYGGSFVLSCCLLQGLVQSVWRFRKDFA
jgi:rod shape determining protein RodA